MGSGAGEHGGYEKERCATRGWVCLGWKQEHVPEQRAVHYASRYAHQCLGERDNYRGRPRVAVETGERGQSDWDSLEQVQEDRE